MLKVVASVLAAAALLVTYGGAAGSAAQPTPNPFALGTLQPLGTPAPYTGPLPNIGRTRSVTPACAAMRDLIVPSFAAAVRADQRFVETRKRLPNYAEIADDPEHSTDVFRQMLLSRLDSDVSTLLQEALVVNKALGDPRLSADVKDPQIAAERRALQALYDAQMTRANLLNEFVMRERVAVARQGTDDNTAFNPRGAANPTLRSPAPIPALTAPPGMPLRNGIALADKNTFDDWGKSLSAYVRSGENQAAKTFLPIAQSCK